MGVYTFFTKVKEQPTTSLKHKNSVQTVINRHLYAIFIIFYLSVSRL